MEVWTPAQYQTHLQSQGNKKRSKYNNKKTPWAGNWRGEHVELIFDSSGECNRFCELKLMEQRGLIEHLQLQKRFELTAKQKGERAENFVIDFVYIEKGVMVAEDYKSPPTRKNPLYVSKRKRFKMQYPDIEFRESGVS